MARKPGNHAASWTAKDFATLKKLVRQGMPAKTMARELGRTESAVRQKAFMEGIRLAQRRVAAGKRRKK